MPRDKELQNQKRQIVNQVDEIIKKYEEKIEDEVKSFLDQEKKTINIIPKKNNMDLKKFLASKFEKLERRTYKSISKLHSKISFIFQQKN